MKSYRSKELIVFDLDGTLTPSKAPMRKDMAAVLARLLEKKLVAVIGGGSYQQFRDQFVREANFPRALLRRLFLFPVCSTMSYRYEHEWKKVYAKTFSPRQKKKILSAFREAFHKAGYHHPKKTYGKIIEDRGSQITFSAVGQDVVAMLGVRRGVAIKEAWRDKSDVRPQLMAVLRKLLPGFTVRSGGLTSIDVTKHGIDKAYGVRQIRKHLHVPIKRMLFIGDALYPGGNDYAAKKTGIDCLRVDGPEDTKRIIREILK
jgi:HAD superfamily hydrolase (TIGR01484 family)